MLALLLSVLLPKPKPAASVYRDGRLTDEELYRRFANGEERAFAVLLERHGGRVMGYLTRFFGGDTELAADLTQDVFLRVVAAAGEFRWEASFTTFLYKTVRNLCIDVMRSRASRPDARAASIDAEPGDGDRGPLSERLAGTSPGGDARTLSGELSEALEAGLARLPPEQREVFLMREVEGLKFGDIAEVLGVNENTVKSRMHYAVLSLRDALSEFRGPE